MSRVSSCALRLVAVAVAFGWFLGLGFSARAEERPAKAAADAAAKDAEARALAERAAAEAAATDAAARAREEAARIAAEAKARIAEERRKAEMATEALRKQIADLLAQQVHRGVVVTGPQAGTWVQMLDRAQKKVKAAYLGVSASPLTPALRAQLGLPQGIGLTVDAVEPDSPAAKAGVQQHDVLHRLNDQLLVNWEQLATLIRTFKAGDEVTLHAIRQARPLVLSAKLVEKEVPERLGVSLDPEGIPGMALQQLLPNGLRLKQGEGGWNLFTERPGITNRTAALSVNDGNRAIDITVEDGVPSLVVKDGQGKVLFQGRLKTPDDLKAVPDDVRKMLQDLRPRLQTHDGFLRLPFEEPKKAAPATQF